MKAMVLVLMLSAGATPAEADIFAAQGPWIGEGQLATGAEAPLERGRCKVEVTPMTAGRDVSVTGVCVVSAGASDISLRVQRGAGDAVQAGVWSAATGQVVQLQGREAAGKMELFSTAPLEVEGRAYDARVTVAAEGEGFAIRQMLRAPGAEAWRLVVDMRYRPAG